MDHSNTNGLFFIDAPEGFSIVLKDNGLMVLKKKRYRDLKKVGIGGFQAKTRMLNKKNSKEDMVSNFCYIYKLKYLFDKLLTKTGG